MRPELTTPGFAIIITHELGHFYAKGKTNSKGFACERSADYYAVTVALPQVFPQFRNELRQGIDEIKELFNNRIQLKTKINQSKSCDKHPSIKCRIETFEQGFEALPLKPDCADF